MLNSNTSFYSTQFDREMCQYKILVGDKFVEVDKYLEDNDFINILDWY